MIKICENMIYKYDETGNTVFSLELSLFDAKNSDKTNSTRPKRALWLPPLVPSLADWNTAPESQAGVNEEREEECNEGAKQVARSSKQIRSKVSVPHASTCSPF